MFNLNEILKPNCDYYSKEFTRGTRAYNVTNDKLRIVKRKKLILFKIKFKMYENNLINTQIISILPSIFNQYHYSYVYESCYIHVRAYVYLMRLLKSFHSIIELHMLQFRLASFAVFSFFSSRLSVAKAHVNFDKQARREIRIDHDPARVNNLHLVPR